MISQQSSNGSSSGIGGSSTDNSSTSTPLTEKFTSGTGSVDDHNPLWGYVTVLQSRIGTAGNAKWCCNFCREDFGGSYYRVRAHLLRQKNKGIVICAQVTSEYLVEMSDLEQNATKKVDSIQVPFPTGTTNLNPPIDKNKRRRGTDGPLSMAFSNEARDHLSAQIARLFYSSGLPFNVARNPYFISAFTYAANTNISAYIPPSYNALRTTMLQREKSNIMKLLQPIKDTWVEKGVSIVTDGWTDVQRRPLINYMATSSAGPIFLKAIDGTGEFKDRHFIANLILSVIDEVGAQNVVQVITDNAPVCKAAASIVESMHPHIFWTPCVVHTLNLALRNICSPSPRSNNEVAYGECVWIAKLAEDASFIKKIILNHSMRFAMYKKFVHLRLLSISETRFASVIVMLKRMQAVKQGLLSMIGGTYGSSTPKLQSIALKLFSQPTSSSSAERNWSTYGFIHSLKRNKLNPKRAKDLVFIHTNLRLLSRKNKDYNEGPTKMWDIGGDGFDLVDGAGILEVASLSLNEPELEAALFNDEGEGND
ncbi:hypothetical protein TSUD_400170 [Trifolium subterraneum]|uniref:DUF659 domain-containing protein n=1 Tax=Trifolium subterraneum TaxID=3900 RepID=A0A2Z6NR06_TRISU|nr:hypothetical protein TSUD_400170 [Trifolium subterraneum]